MITTAAQSQVRQERSGGGMGRAPDFDEFVAARSGALLRTAYLLTKRPHSKS